MDGGVRRGCVLREDRLERRFEAGRVEERLWVKVYELLCPGRRAAAVGRPRCSVSSMPRQKGA